MKLLFISNYEPWKGIENAKTPLHHLFGIYDMIESYNVKEQKAAIKDIYGGGEIHFLKCNSSLTSALKVYLLSFKYDYIYDTICVVSKYISILNRFRFLKPKLITIYHHPPFKKILKYGKSDLSIFFSSQLLEEAKKSIKDNRNMIVNEWYPDNSWYDSYKLKGNHKNFSYDFCDNGKTNRNHKLLIEATRELDN